MTTQFEALQAEVLKLPASDRSRLLESLMASLDFDHDIEAAWDVVADQREGELDSGQAELVSFEHAIARLEARFPG